jgi:hypothetical protein
VAFGSMSGRRVAAVLVGFVVCLQSFATTQPAPVAGVEPAQSSEQDARGPADPLAPTVIEGAAAPITSDLSGAIIGSGGTGDPSIGRPIERPAADAPAAPTELTDQRTAFTSTIANPDGTHTLELSQEAVHFQDTRGEWQKIDLSLVSDASGPYSVRTAANDRTLRISEEDAESALARLQVGQRTIALRAIGFDAAESREATADRVTFRGQAGAGTLELVPTASGFAYAIVLDGPEQAATYHFALDTGGMAAALQPDGSVLLADPPDRGLLPGSEVTRELGTGSITAPLLFAGSRFGQGDAEPVSVGLLDASSRDVPDDVPLEIVAGLGPNEVLLTYRIDPAWLQAPEREFPVILDPTACIGAGASGCDINKDTHSFDEFIYSSEPDQHTSGWTVLRLGYDSTSSGEIPSKDYAKLRDLFYFPDVALPDAAQVTAANLKVKINSTFGSPVGENVKAYLVNAPWGTNSVTWNDIVPDGFEGSTYASPAESVPSSPAGKTMTFDVTDMTRAWYTRRGQDWEPNVGILLKMNNEASSSGEVRLYKYSTGTGDANKPKLTITYVVPRVKIRIDPAAGLGTNYAPSKMVAGQDSVLPVTIKNEGSGFSFDASGADHYEIGYRWFDSSGELVPCPGSSDCRKQLGATLASGDTRSEVLTIRAPSTTGQHTLRLDLVHMIDGEEVWASDWADPSLYYSRDKDVLSSESTTWIGSSKVKRAEWGVAVTDGGSSGGETAGITLADGATLSIGLDGKNVSFAADAGLGWADLGPGLGLAYGYESARRTDCSGILRACGWFTNWDESLIADGIGGFVYQSPTGDRSFLSATGTGQLAGNAPVLIERLHYTVFDDNQLEWTSGPTPAWNTTVVDTGAASLTVTNGAAISKGDLPNPVTLTQFPRLNAAVRSSAGSGTTGRPAIGFLVKNSRPEPGDPASFWFYYTFGTSSWQVGSDPFKWVNADVSGAWYHLDRSLKNDVANEFPGIALEALTVTRVALTGDGSGSHTLRFDDVRFEQANGATIIDDTQPAWTNWSAKASLNGFDKADGSHSIQVTPGPWDESPRCAGCFGEALVETPFVSWDWKKVGGSSIAVLLIVEDTRTATEGSLTYFAGPLPPDGAPNPIQVSPTVPTAWTHVVRNVLDDARQVLGFYDDHPLGTDPDLPPAGPRPDPVELTGLRLIAYDGTWGLFDDMRAVSSTRPESGNGDDFVATYPDRSTHTFNLDGRLTAITDRSDNAVTLAYTYDPTEFGYDAHDLDAIHAASHGMALASGTAVRRIDIARGQDATFRQVTFTSKLGSTAGTTNLRADFFVARVADAGGAFGDGDLVKVSPARNASAECEAPRPTGCREFAYRTDTDHRLNEVWDPRWDGTNDFGHGVQWDITNGVVPFRINDKTTGAAQLRIVSYNDTRVAAATRLAKRVVWQDAAAVAAGAAMVADLSPDGGLRTRYTRRACGTGG